MRFQLIQQIERGLCGLRRIDLLFIGDAHFKVRRHGAMIELVDLRHRISFRRGRPQKDQHIWPDSEKIRVKVLQLICVLFRSIG